MNKIIEKLMERLQSDSESYKTASVDARNNRGDSFDEQYFLGKMDYAIDLYDWLKDQLKCETQEV